MVDTHTKALNRTKQRSVKLIEEALLGTKPKSVKRLRLIEIEMKSILKELKEAKNRARLTSADRGRLCKRAWLLYYVFEKDYEVRARPVRPTYLSKVPQSTLRLVRALPKAVVGTYREKYSS